MLQNQLENFLSKQLLNPQVAQYLNELAQLNAKQNIQLQQAKQQQLAQQKDILLLEQLLRERQKLTEAAQQQQVQVQKQLYEQAQKIKLLKGLLSKYQQVSQKEQAEKAQLNAKKAHFNKPSIKKDDKVPLVLKQCKKCSYMAFVKSIICPNCRAVNTLVEIIN